MQLVELPVQVKQVESQLSQVLVPVFPNLPAGQTVTQVVPSRYLPVGQLRQYKAVAPEQVKQEEWQVAQTPALL